MAQVLPGTEEALKCKARYEEEMRQKSLPKPDEQESGRGMSNSDDDKPLGARKAEVKAEKQQKDDESDDYKPLSKLEKESASDDKSA
jgi:hypothetical protein